MTFLRPLALLLAPLLLAAAPPTLQPGNTVTVVIPDPRPETQQLVVDPTGNIPLGRYGRLTVTGLTVEAAQRAAREQLKAYIRNPQAITLALVDARYFVFVTGQVERSGFVRVSPGETVWQAVQRAGGRLQGADLAHVRLAREGKEQVLDVAAFLAGQAEAPPTLEPGDVVFVPAAVGAPQAGTGRVALLGRAALDDKIFVLGAVGKPGLYDRAGSASLLTALGQAGGPTPEAGLTGARLLTLEASHLVDLAAALRGELNSLPHLPEKGGAILYIPPRRAEDPDPFAPQINVIGGVTRPGRYPLVGPTSLVEAVAMAGGPTKEAELDELYLVRETRSYTLAQRFDLERLLAEGGAPMRVRVQPGDTVSVGQSAYDAWRTAVQIISDVAVISAAILIFMGAQN
ncbi:MAG: SLBB domain-containing protein [Myxococcales bacterium]|nr:SLBB domain-containing protein [Myxococcales bacterium]MCB9525050.1 SLBB domain-containing protein [Myxococcales bacterium]